MCTVINHVLSKYLLRKYSGYDLYRIKYLLRKNLDPEVFLVSCIDLFECHRVFSELSGSEVMSSHLRHLHCGRVHGGMRNKHGDI
jgi:hypothetical protein